MSEEQRIRSISLCEWIGTVFAAVGVIAGLLAVCDMNQQVGLLVLGCMFFVKAIALRRRWLAPH